MRTDYAAPSCIEHDLAVVGGASASSEKNSGSLGYARDDTKNKRPSEKKARTQMNEMDSASWRAPLVTREWAGGGRSSGTRSPVATRGESASLHGPSRRQTARQSAAPRGSNAAAVKSPAVP